MNFAMYSGFTELIRQEGIEKACEKAVKMGYTSVEGYGSVGFGGQNAIPDLHAAMKLKNVARQAGLSVACHSIYCNIWENPMVEKELMEQAELACAMGAPYLHHTLLPWVIKTYDAPEEIKAIKEAVLVASGVADYAKTLGVTCIYEDQGCYVNGVNGFGEFWSEMKKRCDNVGICGDFGNVLFVNEKPEEFLEKYIDDICHVHIKDYLWKSADDSPGRYWIQAKDNSWLRGTMIGSGIINFESCMKILKNHGYNGAFALELDHPEPFEDGVYQAMDYLKRYW